MDTFLVFLRGINVGGKNLVKMSDLREFLTGLGYQDVVTHLQSGNAVFRAEAASATTLESQLEAAAKEKLGIGVDFFARTLAELNAIIEANPFPKEAESDPSHLVVLFLKSDHDPQLVESISESNKGPEIIRGSGKQLYITYPAGIGESKLSANTNWKKLGSGTARNWNTIMKLAEMASSLATA